jgi:type IV pilus assembly protein PilM
MSLAKTNQLVGLDIGSHSIKLVELDHSKRGRLLRNFGTVGLPPGAIVEGSIKEVDLISSAIKLLFRNLKVKNRNVATSVSGYSVIAKRLALSKRNEEEIDATIREEAEQHIPFDINEVNIDFDILAIEEEFPEGQVGVAATTEGTRERRDLMNIMLVAARKDIVDDYVNLLQLANLNPGVLDVDAFALQNAVELSAEELKGCFAIVDVGAQRLGINAVKNGVSMFSRDSSYGGYHITQAIMSEFGVNFEEAEKIKLGGAEAGNKKEALERIFAFEVSSWVREIGRALDFVGNTYPEEEIGKIFITGGSCRILGLQKYLESELDIPVEEFNPFRNIMVNGAIFDHSYLQHRAHMAGVAVGLALRSIGDK